MAQQLNICNAGDARGVGLIPRVQEDTLQEAMTGHSVFLPGESMDGGDWQATIQRATESQT